MKKLSYFWILLIGQVLAAQPSMSYEDLAMEAYFADRTNVPIVRGKFLHLTPEDLDTLSIVYIVPQFSLDRPERRYADIKKDGSFELKIDHAIPYQEIVIGISHVGSARIYAHKELFIEIDLQKWRESGKWTPESEQYASYKNDYFNFNGQDAKMNRILGLYDNFELPRRQEAYRLESAAYNKKLNLEERLAKLEEAQKIFTDLENQFFQSQPHAHQWIISEERLSRHHEFTLGAHFYQQENQQMPPQKIFEYQPHLLNGHTNSYYTYLGYFLQHYNRDLYRGLDSAAFSPQKKDLIKIMGGFEELTLRIQHVEKVLPTLHTQWCKQLLEEELKSKIAQTQQINQTLSKMTLGKEKTGLGKTIGSLPQGATLYHAEEKHVDSLIQRIRSQYPNQTIILDVWATWCSPCVEDMKNSKINKDKLKEQSIKLIYLCVNNGSSEEKWRKKVVEIGLDGEHLWLNDELSAKILQHFKLSGYPSYIVIDSKGQYRPHLVSSIQFLDVEAFKKKL
jgi:thiol-disulfide isomerase/thioredoxin